MSRSLARRVLSGVTAALAAVLLGGIVGVAPVAAAPDQTPAGSTPEGSTTLSGVADCLKLSKHLVVSLVVDESGSLTKTDPKAQRVRAALTALDGLAEINDTIDGAKVELSLAVFGDQFRSLVPFTEVNDETIGELRTAIQGLAKLDRGLETDIVNAMAKARDGLNAHAAEVTADGAEVPCNAIVLFTDGDYSLKVRQGPDARRLSTTKFYAPGQSLDTPENVAKVRARGVDAMCRPGGIADQTRSDDISMITVMLSKESSPKKRSFLQALTVGKGENGTCGRADETISGSFLAAADVDLLIGRFDEITTNLNGGVVVPGDETRTICGGDRCDAGTRSFEVGPLTRRVRILTLAPAAGMQVEISGPDGSTTVEEPGKISVGGATGTVSDLAGRGYTIDLDTPAKTADWVGEWKVGVVSDKPALKNKPALVRVYTYSDLAVRLEAPMLTRGESGAVKVVLDLPKDVKSSVVIENAVASARFEDPLSGRSFVAKLAGPPAGPYQGLLPVPADFRSSGLRAVASVKVNFALGGNAEARSTELDVMVRRPGKAVQFRPTHIELPTLTGEGSTTADLLVMSKSAEGCVWFDPAKLTAPTGAGALTVTYDGKPVVSESDCIKVPKGGGLHEIEVTVSPEHRATGPIRGRLIVHEKVGSASSVTDVPVSGSLNRGVDAARRLVLVTALVAAGLLVPIMLLYLINAFGARFQRLDAVRGAVLPVRVRGDRIELMDGSKGRKFELEPEDFVSLAGSGSSKAFTFGGIRFRARPSRNPFGATRAMAAPDGGAEKLKGGVGQKVELDAGLAGSWIFLLDPDQTRKGARGTVMGRVIAFAHELTSPTAFDRLRADLDARLGGTARHLGNAVWTKTVTPSKRRGKASDEPDEAPLDDDVVPDTDA